MISSGGEGGGAAALGYQSSALSKFGRFAPWDAQRIGGSYHPSSSTTRQSRSGSMLPRMGYRGTIS
jgi:hypothetical protein